jgi:hypothetical protein
MTMRLGYNPGLAKVLPFAVLPVAILIQSED